MLRRCGGDLARALTGNAGPAPIIVPRRLVCGGPPTLCRSPYAQTYGVLGDTLRQRLQHCPQVRVYGCSGRRRHWRHHQLRSSVTPSRSREYTFTDLSPLFRDRATDNLPLSFHAACRSLILNAIQRARALNCSLRYRYLLRTRLFTLLLICVSRSNRVTRLRREGCYLLLSEGVLPSAG